MRRLHPPGIKLSITPGASALTFTSTAVIGKEFTVMAEIGVDAARAAMPIVARDKEEEERVCFMVNNT